MGNEQSFVNWYVDTLLDLKKTVFTRQGYSYPHTQQEHIGYSHTMVDKYNTLLIYLLDLIPNSFNKSLNDFNANQSDLNFTMIQYVLHYGHFHNCYFFGGFLYRIEDEMDCGIGGFETYMDLRYNIIKKFYKNAKFLCFKNTVQVDYACPDLIKKINAELVKRGESGYVFTHDAINSTI